MRTTDAEIEGLVALARAASQQEIMPRFRALDADQIDSKSAPDDLVTIADKRSEALISEGIARLMPDAGIIGEEAVADDKSVLAQISTANRVVVIDPIDGTWNYANGLSTFGVILAVVEDGETTVGIIYDPTFDDWVLAKKGQGVWMCRGDGRKTALAMKPAPETLIEASGFIALFLYHGAERAAIAATYPDLRRVMSLRCCCHEYRVLAQGSADFSLHGNMNVWDHAAGVLAVQEAGGVVRLLDGGAYTPSLTQGRLLAASSERLWHQLAEPMNAALGGLA